MKNVVLAFVCAAFMGTGLVSAATSHRPMTTGWTWCYWAWTDEGLAYLVCDQIDQ